MLFLQSEAYNGAGVGRYPRGRGKHGAEIFKTIDSAKNHVEIAFYGGSFTAVDEKLQCGLLAVAKSIRTAARFTEYAFPQDPTA